MTHSAKPKAKAKANYRSANTPATVKKQATIRELLTLAGTGCTIAEIGRALGISRQLALYHVKKMAATAQLVMMVEPCIGNGGIQYRVWDEAALMGHFVRQFSSPRAALQTQRAA